METWPSRNWMVRFTAGQAAQTGTGAPQIVRCELVDAGASRRRADDIPEHLGRRARARLGCFFLRDLDIGIGDGLLHRRRQLTDLRPCGVKCYVDAGQQYVINLNACCT
jgi:hypothetical protein